MSHPKEKDLKSKKEVVKETDLHTLFLHNDDVHSFDYVVSVLMDICDHDPNQAEQCAYIAHYKGKCDVKKGKIEMMKLLMDELRKKGLKATLE